MSKLLREPAPVRIRKEDPGQVDPLIHMHPLTPSMRRVHPHRMSPAAMKTGSLLSWLVMLSTENWEMLSQLLVWSSGSWRRRRAVRQRPTTTNTRGRGTGTHLHLQLPYVIHRPGLVIVVIIGDRGEAAGPLLMGDATFWKVLHRARAANPILRDPCRDQGGFEVLTL